MAEILAAAKEIHSLYPEMEIRYGEPMSRHTSFRIGGPAAAMFFPSSPREAAGVYRFLRGEGVPTLILGNGTNLLVSGEALELAVVCMGGAIGFVRGGDGGVIECGAGALLTAVSAFALKNGLTGLEFASGIPGSVGGAVMMNAGAYGGEMKDVVLSVLSADETGELRERRLEECGFSYRHSVFEAENSLILSVKLKLNSGDPDAIRARMEELSARRRAKQPLNLPSAGSTFKRPAGGYAAAMLEGAGMKGRGVGGACISEKHAGFVVSRGDATFDDVLATMEMAKKAVFDKYGVWLEPEVRIIR